MGWCGEGIPLSPHVIAKVPFGAAEARREQMHARVVPPAALPLHRLADLAERLADVLAELLRVSALYSAQRRSFCSIASVSSAQSLPIVSRSVSFCAWPAPASATVAMIAQAKIVGRSVHGWP